MGFFNRKQKKLALTMSSKDLEKAYHASEQKLKNASYTGSEELLNKTMQEHGNFEYAMLYKNTPEYKKKKTKLIKKRIGRY